MRRNLTLKCVCVCVCGRERERERQREREREGERERFLFTHQCVVLRNIYLFADCTTAEKQFIRMTGSLKHFGNNHLSN